MHQEWTEADVRDEKKKQCLKPFVNCFGQMSKLG